MGIVRDRSEACPCAGTSPVDTPQTPPGFPQRANDYRESRNSTTGRPLKQMNAPASQVTADHRPTSPKVNPSQTAKLAPPVGNQGNVTGTRPMYYPPQMGRQQSGQIPENWKQPQQSQNAFQPPLPQNEPNRQNASSPSAAPVVPSQLLDKPNAQPKPAARVPPFVPEPAVETGGGMSLAAQQGGRAPLAYGALPGVKGVGNRTGSAHVTAAHHAPSVPGDTGNQAQENEGNNMT